MFRKKREDEKIALYEYLYEDYQLPYTGLIEITKQPLSAKILKLADGDWRPEYAAAYAKHVLPKNDYPDTYTHTAI